MAAGTAERHAPASRRASLVLHVQDMYSCGTLVRSTRATRWSSSANSARKLEQKRRTQWWRLPLLLPALLCTTASVAPVDEQVEILSLLPFSHRQEDETVMHMFRQELGP